MLPLPPSRRPDRPLFPSHFRNCSKAAFACFGARLGTSGEAVNAAIGTSLPHCTRQTACEARRTAVRWAFPQVPARRRHNCVSERDLCRCANWGPPPAGALRPRVVLFCSLAQLGPAHARPRLRAAENGWPENGWPENGWREKEMRQPCAFPRRDWHPSPSNLANCGGQVHRASPARSAGPLDRGFRLMGRAQPRSTVGRRPCPREKVLS